jgi:hypothetical protein
MSLVSCYSSSVSWVVAISCIIYGLLLIEILASERVEQRLAEDIPRYLKWYTSLLLIFH